MCSERTSRRSPTPRENRVRRQPALASAHGNRQLRRRLADRARGGGGRQARARRVRADAAARAPADPRGARRRARRGAHARAAVVARLPHGLEPARAPGGRALPRPSRRAPLQRLARAAAARWHPLDDGARPRAAALSRVGDRADALDARLQVRAHGRVRPRLRQLRLHRPRRGRAPRRAGRANSRGAARRPRGVRGRTASVRSSAARTCSAWRRSSRARTWRRCSTRGGRSAARSRSLSPARRAGATSRRSTTHAS